MEKPFIQSTINNHIASVEFFHPKGNSFSSSQLTLLLELFDDLGSNHEVRVIILKSKGDHIFCSGAYLDELLTIEDKKISESFFIAFAKAILAFKECPKFIIGQIEGKVAGGGIGLLAACDYVFALNNADIKLSEVSIGIAPYMIEPPITRRIGIVSFSELTMNASSWTSAKWCEEVKLYNAVYESKDELNTAVNSYANKLECYAPDAIKNLKSVLYKDTSHWESIMIDRAKQSSKLIFSDSNKGIFQKYKSK